ncbi:MAG: ADP-ribosylglycohydrolase family protein, partial [Coriobacteriales bacterium]|nr:ADP-ribosylglycohydrolase family protein [Coriobacteriales bacterium]
MANLKLRDAVYGAAVGDALGVPFEFKARGSFVCEDMIGFGTHGRPAGTWSDDSAMLLACCDSLRVCGRVDVDDMRARFCAWFNDGAYTPDGVVFDYGGTTAGALRSGVGKSGERDNGNGSLMRIAPMAFVDASDEEIRAVSAITHAHELSCGICVDFVGWLRAMAEDAVVASERIRAEFGGRARDE